MRKKSTIIPLALLAYLGAMCYVGREHLYSGNKIFYFCVIAVTLLVIVLLHFSLKRKERLRREREDDIARNENKENKQQ